MNVSLYGDEKEPLVLGLPQTPTPLLIFGNIADYHPNPQRLH